MNIYKYSILGSIRGRLVIFNAANGISFIIIRLHFSCVSF